MSFGGSLDPCAHLKVISIGNLNAESNPKIAADLTDLIS